MNVDQLPPEVLAVLALLAWSVYGLLRLHEQRLVRTLSISVEAAVLHTEADRQVHDAEENHCADEVAEKEHARRVVHARIVARLLAWGVLHDHRQRVRADDRDTRRAARRMRTECREHGSTDDHEEQQQPDARTDEVAEDREERRVVHARSVHRWSRA